MSAWSQIVDGYMHTSQPAKKASPVISNQDTHKECSACKQTLPMTAFYDRFPERKGRTSKCKRCICAQQKEARAKRTART